MNYKVMETTLPTGEVTYMVVRDDIQALRSFKTKEAAEKYIEQIKGRDFSTEPDATWEQKRLITRLCMALGIKNPLEEELMSKGRAGEIIRDLLGKLRK